MCFDHIQCPSLPRTAYFSYLPKFIFFLFNPSRSLGLLLGWLIYLLGAILLEKNPVSLQLTIANSSITQGWICIQLPSLWSGLPCMGFVHVVVIHLLAISVNGWLGWFHFYFYEQNSIEHGEAGISRVGSEVLLVHTQEWNHGVIFEELISVLAFSSSVSVRLTFSSTFVIIILLLLLCVLFFLTSTFWQE